MKIKEYELFKAYYCGLCKAIGSRHGQPGRMTLNYDSTFLALLLSFLSGEEIQLKKERCFVHPFQKRLMLKNSKITGYASDMNLLLAYYNLEDKWRDEKKLWSLPLMGFLQGAFKKLKKKYPQKCSEIEARLKELTDLEQAGCCSMDRAAEPFARLMEEVLDYEIPEFSEDMRKILRWLGYNIGKWIYILDAYDDVEKDVKRGCYNPLLCQFEYSGEHIGEFKEGIRERVEFNLLHSLSEISKAYELLGLKRNNGVVENIIYMGMLRKTEIILNVGSCRNIEESV